jgi:hypothetical protein
LSAKSKKKHNQEIKEWREIYYMHQLKRAQVIFKAMPSSDKGSMKMLLWKPRHLHGESLRGQANSPGYSIQNIPENAQFKVIVQEGEMADRNTSRYVSIAL